MLTSNEPNFSFTSKIIGAQKISMKMKKIKIKKGINKFFGIKELCAQSYKGL